MLFTQEIRLSQKQQFLLCVDTCSSYYIKYMNIGFRFRLIDKNAILVSVLLTKISKIEVTKYKM